VSIGNQEDIDLVVAFIEGAQTRVVLVEAKAETGWTNKQLASKVERLQRIFGDNGQSVPGVKPTFCLCSPFNSENIVYDKWPAWTLSHGKHLFLKLPVTAGRRAVFGADSLGRPSRDRKFWHVRTTDRAAVIE
jgi:hypothetical protein